MSIATSSPIGPLGPADRERWAELWSGYLAFYETELPAEIYEATWSRILDPNGAIRALGARDEHGALVGIAHFLFHAHAWDTRDVCYLQDLFVDPAARGRGYGRALIEAVATAARRRWSRKLYWQTHETNANARWLYDAVGVNAGFIVYELEL